MESLIGIQKKCQAVVADVLICVYEIILEANKFCLIVDHILGKIMKKFILICLLVAFCSTAFSYQTYIPSRFSSKDRLVYYEQQPLFAVRGASSISYLRKFLEVAIKNNWGVKSKRPLGKGKIVKFKSKKEIELNFTHDDKKTLGSRRKMPSLLIDVILANRFKVNGVV